MNEQLSKLIYNPMTNKYYNNNNNNNMKYQ